MQEITLQLRNKVGLHARPAALLVQAAKHFKSRITLSKDDKTVDAKSILNVLTLGAEYGAVVTLRADGEDEALAINDLARLIESSFGEAAVA